MNGQKKRKGKSAVSANTKKIITASVCGTITGMAIIMYIVALLYAFFG